MSDFFDIFNLVVWGGLFLVLIFKFFRSIRLVPTQSAYIVERLGQYSRTLQPGFHALVPFIDKVTFIRDLKEETVDVPPQECFTRDEVQVEVDGVIYISVVDPVKASYGVTNYSFAAMQLAQTTTRSVIGTLELDRTFEERDLISAKVVEVLEKAGETWGIRVHRYEIKNLSPPPTVKEAMEKQVTAERNRRAIVAQSEGDKQSRINTSEGRRLEIINRSEGEMQRTINEAEGRAEEVRAIARATAESIETVARAINMPGGEASVRLQLAERFLKRLRSLADQKTSVLLPADLTNLDKLLDAIELTDAK
ncbi:MAG: stomatin-like protein [Candidatus Latescibacteria bacterium]|jgi:regulator of protease activity HflC (stomatin/prohibitin superfamily)|nr:stomatin-like protein [Candidatus Latescibacterota bacterium]